MSYTKCNIIAPLLASTLPTDLSTNPQAASLARGAAAALAALFANSYEVNSDCLAIAFSMQARIVTYLRSDKMAVPDASTMQSLSDVDSLVIQMLIVQKPPEGPLAIATVRSSMEVLLSRHNLMCAMLTYGSSVGETGKHLESTYLSTDAQRLSAPISATSRRRELLQQGAAGDDARVQRKYGAQMHEYLYPEDASPGSTDDYVFASRDGAASSMSHEYMQGEVASSVGALHGGERGLLSMSPGTTVISALSVATGEASVLVSPSTIPLAIPRLACRVTPSGGQLCYEYSISAAATLFKPYSPKPVTLNPYFYESDAGLIISRVLRLQLQPFGIDEDLPLEGISLPVIYEFRLSRVPYAGENALGQRQVAACVTRDANGWTRKGCRLIDRRADVTGTVVHVKCACNASGYMAVQDLPGGCDAEPLSPLVYDACRVCGGDNSTCRGCDGVVASGRKLDGCLICGGDNSSCAGCDGVPNSGKILDWCGLCGGDNSTCTGCDGKTVHTAVTARTGLLPKSHDMCKSAQHPMGVCGGCNASCKGCDNQTNSGKDWDKCGLCGPYDKPGPGQFSTSTKDNCTLGLKQCDAGQAPDACALCQPLPVNPAVANRACMGCDGVPRLYGRKVVDSCGLCGGDTCSCKDCLGVPGGKAQYDRCGVCNGNNSCLDCLGVPFGSNTIDICGVCGGKNDPRQCTGCDGRVYPRPMVPPYLDAEYKCCPAHRIGCGGLCNASVGCDGNCSRAPKAVDRCGICGGTGLPNTGTCDCAGVPGGLSKVGCDMKCSTPSLQVDTCGVCGGTNKAETGHCDCAGVPYGPSLRDRANMCCTVADMGCDSLCFSGKTFDVCGVCGGDGGTCLTVVPVGASSRQATPALGGWIQMLAMALALVCVWIDIVQCGR